MNLLASIFSDAGGTTLSASRVVGVAAGIGAIALAALNHPDSAKTCVTLSLGALALRDGSPVDFTNLVDKDH